MKFTKFFIFENLAGDKRFWESCIQFVGQFVYVEINVMRIKVNFMCISKIYLLIWVKKCNLKNTRRISVLFIFFRLYEQKYNFKTLFKNLLLLFFLYFFYFEIHNEKYISIDFFYRNKESLKHSSNYYCNNFEILYYGLSSQ